MFKIQIVFSLSVPYQAMTEVYATCKDGKETSELLSSHYSLTTSLSYSSATTLMWGVSSMTAPEMDSEEPGPGTIQELPSKAKAEWAVGRTWGNAVMKGLKIIQGTETGNKVQHMTTGTVQEKQGPWISRWQGRRQRWEIGLASAQPRQGLHGQEWRKVPGEAAQVHFNLWVPTGPWHSQRKPSWIVLPTTPYRYPKDAAALVLHPPRVTEPALT